MVSEYMKEFQRIWENSIKMQMKLMENMVATMNNILKLNVMQENMAVFRAKIQSGGRISIPEADRAALKLKEGDIVKVVVIKEGGGNDGV